MEDDAMPPDSGAGDALASPPQVGDSNTITIPSDLLPDAKVGGTYTVKAVDGDNVTLEASSSGDDNDAWGDEMIAHVKSKGDM